MAKAKAAENDLPAADAPRKREDIGKIIEATVGDDLDWPEEDELPGAHKAEPKAPKPKKPAAPPPEEEAGEDDEGEAGEEDGEALEDEGEDGEPLTEQDKKINSLQKQLKDREEQLEETSAKGAKERRAAARTTIEANLNAWDQHLDRLTLEVTQKKDKMIADQATAWDEGNNALAAKLGADIQQEVIALDRIAGKKAEITGNKKFLTENPNWVPDLPNPAATGKIEDDEMTEPARDWIAAHPKYNSDKKYQKACIAAHYLFEAGVEDGSIKAKLDSPEYFAFIEKHLIKKGLEKKAAAEAEDEDDEGEADPPPPPAPRKRVQPQNFAAPGGSRGGGNPSQGGGKVKATLTPAELEAAAMSGYDIKNPADLLEYKQSLDQSRNKKK